MLITIIVASLILNAVMASMIYSLNKEFKKPQKTKIVYKDKPVEKIVYKDKIVEKIVYKDKPVHEFIKKEEPKVSPQKQELLDVLAELKAKKKKTKKDQDNIYTIEKIIPNIK